MRKTRKQIERIRRELRAKDDGLVLRDAYAGPQPAQEIVRRAQESLLRLTEDEFDYKNDPSYWWTEKKKKKKSEEKKCP